MGRQNENVFASMCLCEHCGKYSYPEAVTGNKGKCPYCGKVLQDDGWAMPVNLVGGRSALGPDLLAALDAKQREADRRAALAQGGSEKKSSLLDGVGSSLPKVRMYGSDGTEDREPPDFAPIEADEDVLNAITDDDAEIRAAAALDLDDDEYDDFGNPIVKKPAGGDGSGDGGDAGGGGDGSGDSGGGFVPQDDGLPDGEPDMEDLVDVDPGDPFDGGFEGQDELPGDMDDEVPGSGFDDPDDVSDDPSGISTLPYDPSGSNMPQAVPPDAVRRAPYSGVTDVTVRRIASPLPRSVVKGFNRGPRVDFRTNPSRTYAVPDGVRPHSGVVARLDMVKIEYPQSFDIARMFI